MNNGTNSSQALDRQIFFNDSLIMNPLEFDRDLSLSTDDLFNPHRQNDPEQLPGSVVPPSITPASEKLPGSVVPPSVTPASEKLPGSVVPPSVTPASEQLPGSVVPPSITPASEQLPGSVVPPSIILVANQSSESVETSLVPLSIDVQNRLMADARTATINVTYHNYTPQAQAAFQYAVSIWESIIVSTIPIAVDAYWQPLDPSILGRASPNLFWRESPGTRPNTWYTSALANQLAGRDLAPNDGDMTSELNSTANWYFGTDGKTPANQYDFVTVALHEILHGLGNIGLMDYSGGQGSWGLGTGFPGIYDRFTENGAGQSLINTSLFPNPSVALGNQLTSNNLFFDGPNAVGANNGIRPKLYAPSQWQQGSSYAHLDELTYPRGNPNSLDTPYFSLGEAIHDPGPIPLGILKDEGWNLAPSPPPPTPPCPDPLTCPVYRFYNPISRGHFFTLNPAEKDNVIAHPEWQYTFEGVGFQAAQSPGNNLFPVFRFYNPISRGHFFTIDPAERDTVNGHPEWQYNFEGIGFYAYGASASLGSDVFRFYNPISRGHFFTTNPAERDNVLAHPDWSYTFEGVGFEATR